MASRPSWPGSRQQLGELVDSNPMFVAAFALLHAESGQVDDARRMLDALAEWAPWPRNWLWLATTTTALEAAVLIGEAEMSRRYSAVLNRYSGSWAMAAGELVCMGPVDRVLGLARLAAGELDGAEAMLTSAFDAARSQGATPWVRRAEDALASLFGQLELTSPLGNRGLRAMAIGSGSEEARFMSFEPVDDPEPRWRTHRTRMGRRHRCLRTSLHQLRQRGKRRASRSPSSERAAGRVRTHAGSSTSRAADANGLGVASYWHVYPSRTDAHHQAELWAAAVRTARVPFGYGHWADISTTDGFARGDLGRYIAAFLRRTDELLGEQAGVFATPAFWSRHVGFDDPARLLLVRCRSDVADATHVRRGTAVGVRPWWPGTSPGQAPSVGRS